VLVADWTSALGDFSRLAEWQNLFRQELTKLSWQGTLERWLPRLISGSMAAGTHGIIRCGHAVRALANEVTAPRLEELADALAYCAARYRSISGAPVLSGDLGLEEATAQLPLLGPEVDRRGPPPRIVKRLNERPDFAATVSRLAPPDDASAALGELAEIGARLYLRDATRHPLVLVHAVTGPAAMQLLFAHVSAGVRCIAFAYVWQAVAAWAAAFGSGLARERVEPADEPWPAIVDLSVDGGDEHAIKFTEACRRLDAAHPSSAFRAAAGDWAHRVAESRDQSPAVLVAAGIRTRLPGE
jgi:hypothetical protein